MEVHLFVVRLEEPGLSDAKKSSMNQPHQLILLS